MQSDSVCAGPTTRLFRCDVVAGEEAPAISITSPEYKNVGNLQSPQQILAIVVSSPGITLTGIYIVLALNGTNPAHLKARRNIRRIIDTLDIGGYTRRDGWRYYPTKKVEVIA